MDDTDKKLLALLRENARQSTSELARQLKLSRTTVQDRINRLENHKIVIGYTAKLNPEHTGKQLTAHVMVKISPMSQNDIVTQCHKILELTALYTISGEFDLLAIVRAATPQSLDEALDKIRNLQGVERTTTSIVLTTKIER